MPVLCTAMLGTALLLAAALAAPAAENAHGAVEQSGGHIVPQNPSLPKLNLTDAQRQQISQVLTPRIGRLKSS